jgi:FdhE protein
MANVARRLSPAAELERRSARAELLAAQPSAAQEPLRFAGKAYRAQAQLAAIVEEQHRSRPLSGRLEEDVDGLLPRFGPLIALAEEHGPEELALEATRRRGDDPSVARARLMAYWNGDTSAREDYLSRLLLRPYAEVVRAEGVMPDRLHRQGHCPFCGGAPWISSRTSIGDSEGGLRLLGCALCGNDWNFNRICCPSCHEEDPVKLPVYQSDAHPLARIEACETCRRYVKSIDLTKDARPIPEVDDLLSLSMDLWAMDEGLTRIEPGLAGV